MDGMITKLLDFLDFLDDCVKKFCIILTAGMTLTIILQVVFRYVFTNPLVWTEELARYLMIWLAFMGASSLIKQKEHIFVDYFLNKFPGKLTRFVNVIIKICILILLLFVFYTSITVYTNVSSNQVTPALQISSLWPQMGIVMGVLLMILQIIGLLLRELFLKEEGGQ